MSRVRTAILQTARTRAAASLIGLLDRLVSMPPDAFAILTYHRVDDPSARPWLYPPLLSATPAGFQEQMEEVRRLYRPISVRDLLAALVDGRPLPPRSVLITFDDGYKDFAEHAWPVLRRLEIPVTLFVPTRYPGEAGRSFWWDRLWATIARTSGLQAVAAELQLPVPAKEGDRRSVSALIEHYKSMPHDEAMASVDALCSKLGPADTTADVLEWNELRQLVAQGVLLAPHSRNHPLLTKVPAPELRAEIDGSRADLLERIPVHSGSVVSEAFAYPAGAFNEEVVHVLDALDFRVAFTTQRGINRLGHTHPLLLRRINVGSRATPSVTRGQIAAASLQLRLVAH